MDALRQDLAYAVRTLRGNAGYAAAAIVVLALGIGATTAIFSVVEAVLLRPLPYADADRLLRVEEDRPDGRGFMLSPTEALAIRDRIHGFEEVAARRNRSFVLTGEPYPEQLFGSVTTPNLFAVLGLDAMLGRTFAPDEHEDSKVVVLRSDLWQRRWGADPDVVGGTVTLNGEPHTVIGIVDEQAAYPRSAEVWVSTRLQPTQSTHNTEVVGRLRAGVERAAVTAELTSLLREIELASATEASEGADPDPDRLARVQALRAGVESLPERIVGNVRPALLVLLGAVCIVLLIAAANVANLQLARGLRRERELAVRTALGAGRGRILRQLVTESALLAVAGGALGLVVAHAGLDVLLATAPADLPRLGGVGINAWVLGFAMLVTLVTGIATGLVPGLHVTRHDVREALTEGGLQVAGSRRGTLLRGGLLAVEVALALILMVGAGLLVQSFVRLQGVELGFDSEEVTTFQLSLWGRPDVTRDQWGSFFERVLERLRAHPGVESAGTTNLMPGLGANISWALLVDDSPVQDPGKAVSVGFRTVSPGYFETLRIPLRRGRLLSERDGQPGQPEVVVVNETFASRMWPDADPLGKRVAFEAEPASGSGWATVVGVVGNVRLSRRDDDAPPTLYAHYLRRPQGSATFMIRTDDPAGGLAGWIREMVADIDPLQPVSEVRALDERLSEQLARPRFNTWLLGLFAGLALLLAAVGEYAVVHYWVGQRTHEIGVRMALGADRGEVVQLVVGQSLLVVGVGVVLGLAGSYGLSRFLESMVFAVEPTDPATYAGVTALLVLVAVAASWVPARRAASIDPVRALRIE